LREIVIETDFLDDVQLRLEEIDVMLFIRQNLGKQFARAVVAFLDTDLHRAVVHADGIAFCDTMAERAKVVAIPTQVFYEDGSEHGRHLIRWAFCKQQDLIVEGLERLRDTDLSHH